MYDNLKCKTLFNLDETIAKDIFNDVTFPWETWRRFRNDAANGDRNGWRFVIWYTVNPDRCSMYL